MKKILFLFFLLSCFENYGQNFEPCTNGNQNSCKCQNAPILENLAILDGYEYDMTLYQHPSDGPQPMCPPPQGNGTTSNNPTWIAFKAQCIDLQIKVTASNCLDSPGAGVSLGVQAAVYTACPASSANAISCNTDVANCKQNSERILELTNLTIGNVYYLLIDGCGGSACHIKINVINCSLPKSSIDKDFQYCNELSDAPFTMIENNTENLLLANGKDFKAIKKTGQVDTIFQLTDISIDSLSSNHSLTTSQDYIYAAHKFNDKYVLRKYENNGVFIKDIATFDNKVENIFFEDGLLFALSNSKIYKIKDDVIVTDNLIGNDNVHSIFPDTALHQLIIITKDSFDLSIYDLNGLLIKTNKNNGAHITSIIAQKNFIYKVYEQDTVKQILIMNRGSGLENTYYLPTNVVAVNMDLSKRIFFVQQLPNEFRVYQMDDIGRVEDIKLYDAKMTGTNYTTIVCSTTGHIFISGEFEYDGKNCNLIKIKGRTGLEKKIFVETRAVSCSNKGLISISAFNFDDKSLKYFVNDTLLTTDSLLVGKTGWYDLKVLDKQDTFLRRIFVPGNDFKSFFDATLFVNISNIVLNEKVKCTIQPIVSCSTGKSRLTLKYSQLVDYVNSNIAPDSILQDKLVWENISNQQLSLEFKTKATTQIGQSAKFIFNLEADNDTIKNNNEVIITKTIFGSYDPNDINVYPNGVCGDNYVLRETPLTYTIRFQNIGNYPAKDVAIIDSLSDYLDLNTLNILDQSHHMEVQNTRNNILLFEFRDIYLPGVEQDEEKSMGHITFSVKLKSSVSSEQKIRNYADIYFDKNLPITTNTVYNTMSTSLPVIVENLSHEACMNDTIKIADLIGIEVTKDTTISRMYQSVEFCDSMVNHTFIFKDLNVKNDTIGFCDGSKVELESGNVIVGDTLIVLRDGCNISYKYYHKIKLPSLSILDSQSGQLTAKSDEDVLYQWIDCDGNKPMVNETKSTFKPVVSGNYTCEIISLSTGCTFKSECINVIVTSTTDLASDFRIYPNPSIGSIVVTTTKSINKEEINIFDMLGRNVTFECKKIDGNSYAISELPMGILVVKVGEKMVKINVL